MPAELATLGFSHLQFEALLTAARESTNPYDFALVAMLGLLGLRIFEATSADITDLGEEHGHRVLRACGKDTKIIQVPLPPAVGRAIDRATGARDRGPILLNGRSARMDRHAATRRLRRLAPSTGLRAKVHLHMLRHTFVTTMLDAGVDLRTSRSPLATLIRAPRCATATLGNCIRWARNRRSPVERLSAIGAPCVSDTPGGLRCVRDDPVRCMIFPSDSRGLRAGRRDGPG